MESIWRKEIPYIEAEQHAAYNNYWDVIVIGAGLSGLLTAYYLREKGKEEEKILEEETKAALRLGMDAYLTKETKLPFPVKCAMCFPGQAQFSPLKFLKHIASKLDILEHTKVIKIKGNKVITDDKIFTAEKIVMAAHYPFKK